MLNPNLYHFDTFHVDPLTLAEDVHYILDRWPSDRADPKYDKGRRYKYDRISLVHEPGVTDPFDKVYGAGRQNYMGRQPDEPESQFTVWNEEFEGLYIHEVYLTLEEVIGKKLGRVRLMRLDPFDELGWHQDFGERYHLNASKGTRSEIECAYDKSGVRPPSSYSIVDVEANGSFVYLDTEAMHRARNTSDKVRFHVVFNVAYDL